MHILNFRDAIATIKMAYTYKMLAAQNKQNCEYRPDDARPWIGCSIGVIIPEAKYQKFGDDICKRFIGLDHDPAVLTVENEFDIYIFQDIQDLHDKWCSHSLAGNKYEAKIYEKEFVEYINKLLDEGDLNHD